MLSYNWKKSAELAIKEKDVALAHILLRQPYRLTAELNASLEDIISTGDWNTPWK